MRSATGPIVALFASLASACVGEIAGAVAVAVGDPDAGDEDPGIDAAADASPGAPDAAPPGLVWKAVLMTGDDSISAFDNAREAMKALFEADGVLDEDTIQLSRDGALQTGGVRATSVDSFADALLELAVGDGDGCVVFMTSHGSPSGFYIRDQNELTPTRLDRILDDACGDRPTVALISACYSGVFVDPAAQPNRIILTAAREDRTSFGCSAEAEYTYWDGCLIDRFTASDTWAALYDDVTACIEAKEGGGFTPSLPQGFFGADVRDLPIFHRRE